MKKKLFSLILAILVFCLPLSSLASERITLSFSAGEGLNLAEGLPELINAVSLSCLRDEKGAVYSLILSDNQIIDLGFQTDENGIYTSTSLLNNTTYYLPWSYLEELLADMIPQDADADAGTLISGVQNFLTGEGLSSANDGEALGAAQEVLSSVMTAFTPVLSKTVTENGTYVLENGTEADTKTSLILTGEDLLPLMDSELFQTALAMMSSSGQETADAEELKSLLAALPYELQIIVYFQKEAFAAAEASAYDKTADTTLGSLKADAAPAENGKLCQLDLRTDTELLKVELTGRLLIGNEGTLDGKLTLNLNGLKFGLGLEKKLTQKGNSLEFALYGNSEAESFEKAALSVKLNRENSRNSVSSIVNPAKAKDLSAFTDADFQALEATVSGQGTVLLFSIMNNLPPACLKLLSGIGGGQ